MSLEPMERTLCPVCDKWVEDYAPGESFVTIEGERYHPACAASEGLTEEPEPDQPWFCAYCHNQVAPGRECDRPACREAQRRALYRMSEEPMTFNPEGD